MKIIVSATVDLDGSVIELYPNPFSDHTSVKISEDLQIQMIDLIDAQGRIVRTIDNVHSSSVTIQRGNLPGGIYFSRIHVDDIYTRKILIR